MEILGKSLEKLVPVNQRNTLGDGDKLWQKWQLLVNEAALIKQIVTDILNKLNESLPSRDFDGFVGMRAHSDEVKNLLCLDSDEVRMVGIWGPSGIGKTTIARVVYNELCNSFQMIVFMESIEGKYTRPCSDDYSLKLRLQQHFMSHITNERDIKVSHLGVIEHMLKDKKVLVVLDGVYESYQLEAMAKETWWFGPGSRIIITTQNQKLFKEHEINQIYEVDYPPDDEALQILCMYAFSQKSPKDGFLQLAREVIRLADNLPLGLKAMGSYLRGMSKQEWTKAITRVVYNELCNGYQIRNKLNNSTLVGVEAHQEKMEQLLSLNSDEVRMIGIWGQSGIGKTTIARVVYEEHYNSFEMRVFMESRDTEYTRPCFDENAAKVKLQQQFLSKITNKKDKKIDHLGVALNYLCSKKILVVLDGVDSLFQLDAMAADKSWFGPGSRIIVISQHKYPFLAHGIDYIYHVGLPSTDETLQILCTYAFGQNSPKYGFEEIARKVTEVAGRVPSGLRAMGLYLQGKSKEEWENTLPSNSIDDGKVKPPNIQVFINFRGAELRRTFISHLVDALKRSEINVFIDKQEQRGEDVNILFKRIEGSGITIVVFSNMYTDSKWCLNELAKIKEREHQGLLKVIPIFYKVDLENVKCLKGTFGDYFRDQKYKFNTEESKIKQWKEKSHEV